MKKIQTFIYVLLMGFAFAACQDDSLGGTEQGGIRIALTDGTAGVDVTTRSTPSELFDGFKQKFKFQIKGDNYDQTHDWTDEVIPLAAGVYDITATCGTEQADGVVKFDAPCYTGTKEGLKVNAGETATTAEISCKVTNALVSLKFVEENEADFADAYAMIAVGTGAETRWDPLTKSAYFKAGSSLSKLTIFKDGSDSKGADILTDAQKDANFPETFAAGDHLILTLSIAKANGNVKINVSVEVKTAEIKETIPLEWLPAPKIAGFNSEGTNLVEQVETADAVPAVLNFSGAMAIQDVELTLDLKDQDFSSLNKTYMLASLPEDDKSALTNAGITLPTLGENASNIDFTTLAGKLKVAQGSETSHDIKLRVKANNRWSSEEGEPSVYTIKTVAPKIKVMANESDIWSKSLTISGITVEVGNENTIKSNLKYQFLENGEWKDCEGMVASMENHPSDGKMQIRAVYRDVIECEPTTFDLETPAQVPNANMDAWTTSTRYDQPYYQPWDNDIEQWWDTNNNETMPKSYWTYPNYKCFPTTTYTNSSTSGRAAEIRSVAINGANSEWMGSGSTRGVLYAGITDNDGNMTEGRDWNSRPSKVTFMYKYDSQDDEHFGAYFELLAEDGTSIVSGNFLSENGQDVSTYTKAEIPLQYSNTQLKAATIKIRFVSVADGESVYTGKQNITIPAGNYKIYGGSVLTIDDIQLIYDK